MGLSITKDIEDCDTYNIGSHKGRSLLELLQALKEVTNKDFKINHQDQRSCDLSKIVLNSNKILTHFPDHSFIDINDGIEEMWNYYKQNFKSKKS
ncbi:MAG: UDP-glucose 4-epimerase [Bacteriovoracaceae bacterium]|jgi:UDP-glucose 4-epimerase